MPKFIIIADMGDRFDRKKEILENATEEEAANMAWELANEVYSDYEGSCGIYSFDDFLEEYEGDREAARESYEDSINSWVDYYVAVVTEDTPCCPSCGEPLCEEELEGYCFNCNEYCGE